MMILTTKRTEYCCISHVCIFKWTVSNSDWKYKGYFKTPVGTYANVGTLTDTQTTKCAVHWLAFGLVKLNLLTIPNFASKF